MSYFTKSSENNDRAYFRRMSYFRKKTVEWKLVLSEPYLPIKALALKCLNKKNMPRNPKDLNQDIIQLDHHCDQIQLIGNFAVACTDSFQTKLKVQSVLASLEFCENYIVPASISFYMDSSNLAKRNFFKFLADECQKEIKSLQFLLDNIIDSPAFMQISHDDLSVIVQEIKENIAEGIFNKKDAETFLLRGFKLVKHLQTTDDKFVCADRKIKEASMELEKVLNILQSKLQINSFSQNCLQNIVAEMEMIIFCINNMSQALNQLNSVVFSFSSTIRSSQSLLYNRQNQADLSMRSLNSTPQGNDCNNYWIKGNLEDLPSDNQYLNNMNLLEPFLIKVAETPRKLTLFSKTPNTRSQSKVDTHSAYNITDVLEQLSNLSDTFLSTDDIPIEENIQIVKSSLNIIQNELNEEKKEDGKPIDDISSLLDMNYDTINRLEDLNIVENKLVHLKET